MTNEKLSTLDEVMELATRWARKRFANDPDCEAKVSDSVSVAWEFFSQYGDRAMAGRLAALAIKRVGCGRQFRRSLTASHQVDCKMPRSDFDVNEISSVQANPANIACFRVDFAAWLETLTPRARAIAEALGMGDTTSEVAKRHGCTPGRISQRRRELADSYFEFVST